MNNGSTIPVALEERRLERGRLYSPSAQRNRDAIFEALSPLLPPDSHVLEIASGTGEHAFRFAVGRPDIRWQASDINAESRASVDAWAVEAASISSPCLDLDMEQSSWFEALGKFDAMFCANMIHIAPWAASVGLFKGAEKLLNSGRCLHLYGPFKEGDQSKQSNLDFDGRLRSRNPDWGVREISDLLELAYKSGLSLSRRTEMPANNLLLTFEATAS